MPAADPAPGERLDLAAPVDLPRGRRAVTAGDERAPVATHDRPAAPRLLGRASDEMLAREVWLGNDAAFQVIYERHASGLRKLCRRMLRSPEDAEDALQQSLASAWSAMRAAEGDLPRQVRPWLYAVAQNRCLSMLRDRLASTVVVEDQPAALGYVDEIESRSELRSVLADVRDLPMPQRQALVLSELGGLSHADVADRLGRRQSMVKSLVFEARATLTVWREARDTPCNEIREQLSTLHGGALRRRALRRHLELCESCRAYRATERARPRPVAALLPGLALVKAKAISAFLTLTFALKASSGWNNAGAVVGGGGLGALGSSAMTSCVACVACVAGVTAAAGVAGGVAVLPSRIPPRPPTAMTRAIFSDAPAARAQPTIASAAPGPVASFVRSRLVAGGPRSSDLVLVVPGAGGQTDPGARFILPLSSAGPGIAGRIAATAGDVELVAGVVRVEHRTTVAAAAGHGHSSLDVRNGGRNRHGNENMGTTSSPTPQPSGSDPQPTATPSGTTMPATPSGASETAVPSGSTTPISRSTTTPAPSGSITSATDAVSASDSSMGSSSSDSSPATASGSVTSSASMDGATSQPASGAPSSAATATGSDLGSVSTSDPEYARGFASDSGSPPSDTTTSDATTPTDPTSQSDSRAPADPAPPADSSTPASAVLPSAASCTTDWSGLGASV